MTKSFSFAAGIVAALALASPALAERNAQPTERGAQPAERNAKPGVRMHPINGLVRMNPLLSQAKADRG
jgi:hypothetical protein